MIMGKYEKGNWRVEKEEEKKTPREGAGFAKLGGGGGFIIFIIYY